MFMHIVVLIGLIIFLGGLDLVRSILTKNAFVNYWADASKLMMMLTGLFFTIQCVSCLLYTSPSPRDGLLSRMPSSA